MSTMHTPATRLLHVAVLLSPLLLIGCVERIITVESTPPGALVYLNDLEVGRTPVSVPFTYYGTYDVRLEHEGYWLPREAAREKLGISEQALQDLLDRELLDHRTEDGQSQVYIRFRTLWTAATAEVPWWEIVPIDLLAELKPGRTQSNVKWHFQLEPIPMDDEARLLDRALEMRQISEEEFERESPKP